MAEGKKPLDKILDARPPLLAGLSLGKIGRDIMAELGRLGKQGSSELANALFSGTAFVIYGAGQLPPEQTNKQQQQIRSGRSI
jgi:hypothetical protein